MSQEVKAWQIYTHKIPAQVKDQPSSVYGEIKIRKPTVMERFEYIETSGFEVDEDTNQVASKNKLASSRKLVECSIPHYISVDLTRADGSKIECVEEMLVDADCEQILFDIGGLLLGGFKVSKN